MTSRTLLAALVACHLVLAFAVDMDLDSHRHEHRHARRHHADEPDPHMFDENGDPLLPAAFEAPRFAETEASNHLGVATDAALAQAPDGLDVGSNADIVKSIYDLLAQKRDKNVQETSKIMQKKVETAKEQELLRERSEELKERAAMLTRLQYCLEQDGRVKAKRDADLDAANAKNTSAGMSQDQIDKRAAELDKLDDDLRNRLKDLERREADLRRRWGILKQQLEALRKERQALEDEKRVTNDVNKTVVKDSTSKFCPGECRQFTDCGTCVDNPKCGWCRTSQSCMNVVDGGAPVGNCSKADFSHLYCKSEMCEEHRSCRSCMADPDCGRCATNGQCGRGDITGPAQGTCSSWNYAAPLRVFNLNIYGRDTNNVTERAANIFAMIEEANADFITLQEVEDWFLELMAQQKWAQRYHASDFGSGHAPGGLLILSKYPLGAVSYYEKTQPGQVEVDQRGHVLVVNPKIGEQSLAIACAELDWRSADSRADSLEFIFSVLGSKSDVILGGDFNFDFGAQPETSKIPETYKDAWLELRPTQPGFTWDPIHNSYARQSDPKSRPSRIDRLFVRSNYAQMLKISKVGSPDVSPHYGLLADVKVFSAYC